MRLTLCLLLFLISYFSWAQPQKISKKFLPNQADSCLLSIHKVVTKEMVPPHGQPIEKQLKQLRVSDQDVKILSKKVGKKSSYQDSRALLTHYNVIFDFYKNGSSHGNITFSTITGNIEINNSINRQHFYGNVSKKFGHYLLSMFRTYDIVELIDTNNLQWLEKENEY